MNKKDLITEQQLIRLLHVFELHYKMVNKLNMRDLKFMEAKLFKQHKTEVNNLYEELDNVQEE